MTLFGPLFWYELRRLPRRRSMHLLRMLYAGALLVGLVVVYLRMFRDVPALEALANPGRLDRAGTAEFANSFLMAFLAVQQIAVIVLTPIYAAGSIADEKERRTLDFLLSSPLSRFQIVFGKVCSRLVFVGSILAAGLPVLMLTLLFGGVDLEHLLAGFAVSAITAIFLANVGVLLACMKENLRETLPGMVMSLVTPALFGMCGCGNPAFSAISPITVLGFLFRIWLENDPLRDDTWMLVGVFAAVQSTISLALFQFSIGELGGAAKVDAQTHESSAERLLNRSIDTARWLNGNEPVPPGVILAPTLRRTYDVPRIGKSESPHLWKERYIRKPWSATVIPVSGLVACLTILAGYAFIVLVILFVQAASELADKRSLSGTANTMLKSVFPLAITLWPAFLGARAAAALGRERAGQTLLTLFTLPGDRIDILKAIAGAILLRDRWAIWFFGTVLALGIVTGGIFLPFGFAALVLFTGCAAWAIAFGIWLSVQIETPARASLVFLAVWGGVLLAPWLAAPLFPAQIRHSVEATCPPYGMSKVLVTWQKAESDDELAAQVALAMGFGMFVLAAGFTWHAARTFEREGR